MYRLINVVFYPLWVLLCTTVCTAKLLPDSTSPLWTKVTGVRATAVIGVVSAQNYSLIATASDCLLSKDAGRTWTSLSKPLPLERVDMVGLSDDTLFATSPSGTTYQTTDGGLMWNLSKRSSERVYPRSIKSTWPYMFSECRNDTLVDQLWVGVERRKIGAEFTTVRNVCNSPYGTFFIDIERGLLVKGFASEALETLSSPDVSDLPGPFFAYTDDHLYVQYKSRFFRLHMISQKWTEILAGQGVVEIDITDLSVNGDRWIAGTRSNGVLVGRNNDNVATKVSASLGGVLITGIHKIDSGAILQTMFGGLIGISDSTWTLVRKPHPDPTPNSSLCIVATGTHILGVSSSGKVYRSTDNAATWTQTKAQLPEYSVHALASDGQVFFAASELGVLVSRDNGTTWSSLSEVSEVQPVNSVDHSPYGLAVISNSGAWIVHKGQARAVSSVADGSSQRVLGIAYTDKHLFAASKDGVLWSSNSGASWNLDKIRENLAVRSVSVHPFGLLAIGDAGDMYIRRLPD